MANPAFGSKNVEKLLNAAFETNDLKRMCHAVDAAVLRSGSIVEIALAAKVDRTTLYRAFRLAKGPALDTMIQVLRVLGFRLIVEVRREVAHRHERSVPVEGRSTARRRAAATARQFTAAFKTEEMDSVGKVFKRTLHSQENVSEFAGKTIRTRESLYRVFTQYPKPRFSTLLSFLNALELQFAVRRLPRPMISRRRMNSKHA